MDRPILFPAHCLTAEYPFCSLLEASASYRLIWHLDFLALKIRAMHRRLVVGISIAYFIAFLGVGLVIASLGPIMLALSVQTGAEVDNLAFLFTSRAVGYLLGSVVGGVLVDKVPGHRMMFAGLLVNSVATGIFPFMNSIPILAVLSSAQGLTMGFLDTGTAMCVCCCDTLLILPTASSNERPFVVAARESEWTVDASDALLLRHRCAGVASLCSSIAECNVFISCCILGFCRDLIRVSDIFSFPS